MKVAGPAIMIASRRCNGVVSNYSIELKGACLEKNKHTASAGNILPGAYRVHRSAPTIAMSLLRCGSIVVAECPTEAFAACNRTSDRTDLVLRIDQAVPETLVVSLVVIMLQEIADRVDCSPKKIMRSKQHSLMVLTCPHQ